MEVCRKDVLLGHEGLWEGHATRPWKFVGKTCFQAMEVCRKDVLPSHGGL